jgi:hypothetical protein
LQESLRGAEHPETVRSPSILADHEHCNRCKGIIEHNGDDGQLSTT